MEQTHHRLDAVAGHDLGHHDHVGGERFDDGGHVLQVPPPAGLEAKSRERRAFTGSGEVLGIEAGDPQGTRHPWRRRLVRPRDDQAACEQNRRDDMTPAVAARPLTTAVQER